jgi:capsule polysaccharide export protein KpsE/RkpR
MGHRRFAERADARVKLARQVELQLLAGGVIEVKARNHDPRFARDLVVAYTAAVEKHLADLGEEQVEFKRSLVTDRWTKARASLDKAEYELAQYRLAHNLASPESTMGQNLSRRLGYESQLRAKEVQLQTLRSVAADGSFQIRQLRNEMEVLRRQIAELDDPAASDSPYRLSQIVVEYLKLFRNQQYALSLVEGYRRFFETIAIQDVTTQANLQMVEHPFVDPARHFNLPAMGVLLALILLAAFTEWYVPFTGLGRRRSGLGARDRRVDPA